MMLDPFGDSEALNHEFKNTHTHTHFLKEEMNLFSFIPRFCRTHGSHLEPNINTVHQRPSASKWRMSHFSRSANSKCWMSLVPLSSGRQSIQQEALSSPEFLQKVESQGGPLRGYQRNSLWLSWVATHISPAACKNNSTSVALLLVSHP